MYLLNVSLCEYNTLEMLMFLKTYFVKNMLDRGQTVADIPLVLQLQAHDWLL